MQENDCIKNVYETGRTWDTRSPVSFAQCNSSQGLHGHRTGALGRNEYRAAFREENSQASTKNADPATTRTPKSNTQHQWLAKLNVYPRPNLFSTKSAGSLGL
jgi:hypothetical protein